MCSVDYKVWHDTCHFRLDVFIAITWLSQKQVVVVAEGMRDKSKEGLYFSLGLAFFPPSFYVVKQERVVSKVCVS